MFGEGGAPLLRNAVAGVGLSAYEFLLAGDVAHILQTACVTGKVAVGEPEQGFQRVEISGFVGHQYRHDTQSNLAFKCFIYII